MNWTLFAGFLVAALGIMAVPGPDMLFILAKGITGGARAGAAAACGAAAAMTVHTALVTFGLATLFRAAPLALEVLRFVGAVYLAWLAVRTFRSPAVTPPGGSAGTRTRFWVVFGRGAITNLLNPKIILFYLVFLPQFVDPGMGHVPVQLMVLGTVLLLVGLGADLGIGVVAGRIGGLLRRRPGVGRLVNRIAGTIFGALAVRLVAGD